MGKRRERRMAALMASGRRVKLDLFTEPSGILFLLPFLSLGFRNFFVFLRKNTLFRVALKQEHCFEILFSVISFSLLSFFLSFKLYWNWSWIVIWVGVRKMCRPVLIYAKGWKNDCILGLHGESNSLFESVRTHVLNSNDFQKMRGNKGSHSLKRS